MEIEAVAAEIVVALSTMDGVDNVESDAVSATPQVLVDVDPYRAALIGSSTAQIAGDIRNVLVGNQIGSYTLEDGQTLSAFLNVDDAGVDTVEGLRAMPVSGMRGSQPLERSPRSRPSRCVARSRVSMVRQRLRSRPTSRRRIRVRFPRSAGARGCARGSGCHPPTVEVTFAGATAQQNEAFAYPCSSRWASPSWWSTS